MKLYTREGWLDAKHVEEVANKNDINFIVIIGKRQIGKTYNVLSLMLDENKNFIFMRRVKPELEMLEKGVKQIIDTYKPDEIAIEELFFAKNVKTGIAVAHARGVILLTAIKECGKIFEYTPLQIKQALTGYGRAEKIQIQQMVKTMLGLKGIPRPDDAADALAVALCHSHTNKLGGLFSL